MEINELYLKTAFCCMACDGDIAEEEINLVKQYATKTSLFDGVDVQSKLDNYVSAINKQGKTFLSNYIKNIVETKLDENQELELAKIAIKMILEDKEIRYSEISFFKKIRNKLKTTDDKLLVVIKDEPLFKEFSEIEPEDFLLPDIMVNEDAEWNVAFENIELNLIQQ